MQPLANNFMRSVTMTRVIPRPQMPQSSRAFSSDIDPEFERKVKQVLNNRLKEFATLAGVTVFLGSVVPWAIANTVGFIYDKITPSNGGKC